MSLFSRKIDIDINPAGNDTLALTTTLADMYHDIRLRLEIGTWDGMIRNASLHMERIPHPDCRKMADKAQLLCGLEVGPGFTKKVLTLLGGECGCPNLVNLVFITAPLARNAAVVLKQRQEKLTDDEMDRLWQDVLGGVCAAYPKKAGQKRKDDHACGES